MQDWQKDCSQQEDWWLILQAHGKLSLKGVLLLSEATFVSANFTSAFAQIGKTLQVLCVGNVLLETGVEETRTSFAGAT